jgi:Protein of unknown function (DUF559)
MAAVLACGEEALLSHGSAAALWGLMRLTGSPVDVAASGGKPGREGIRLHRTCIHPEDRAMNAGVPVTSVARTLLDLADSLDEQRWRRAAEEADRLGLLEMAALERVCERGVGRRGLTACRHLVAAAKAPVMTRSPLEDRFAEFCREHISDLPAPLTNVSVLDREVDAYWPSHHLVVEMDSWEFHHHRAAFERDRARDAAMHAAGYRVIRLTHRQLESEAPRIATQLRKLLGAA